MSRVELGHLVDGSGRVRSWKMMKNGLMDNSAPRCTVRRLKIQEYAIFIALLNIFKHNIFGVSEKKQCQELI